jgi:HSP20 family protein
MQGRLNRLMGELATPWDAGENGALSSAWLPPVDIFEDDESISIVAELPGVKSEDVKISLENQTLTLRGEKKQATEEQSVQGHRFERAYGRFERTFTLPTSVDGDNISAVHSEGLLTLRLPKVEKARPREIPITTA